VNDVEDLERGLSGGPFPERAKQGCFARSLQGRIHGVPGTVVPTVRANPPSRQ